MMDGRQGEIGPRCAKSVALVKAEFIYNPADAELPLANRCI